MRPRRSRSRPNAEYAGGPGPDRRNLPARRRVAYDDVMSPRSASSSGPLPPRPFTSGLVDRLRSWGNTWELPGGRLELPEVFGFCRGVEHALAMLAEGVEQHRADGKRIFLLGEIIHNPWVNEYFQRRGVRILDEDDRRRLEEIVGPADCAVIPAFGVPVSVRQRLEAIGCEIVDTSCGDVRRLWRWAEGAVQRGYGVLIYGRSRHEETVVTKSRLTAAGGEYLVVGDLAGADMFCQLITGQRDAGEFSRLFGPDQTSAASAEPFLRLAQVSQTTMLYEETMTVRDRLREAFAERFGPEGAAERLAFEPTVCRATQQRQSAAVRLCRSKPDLAIVVGGFGSSNTRHLHELAGQFAPAYLIEDAEAVRSDRELWCFDPADERGHLVEGWLPAGRPLRIAVLAGASCPEVVVGEVLERLAEFLSAPESID